jgi:hypothetical protein
MDHTSALNPQNIVTNTTNPPRKLVSKKSKRFQIIPKTTSSGSSSGSSSFEDPLKGAVGEEGTGGNSFLPNLAEASFPMKSIIYELKEVSIRIMSLSKIEETLSLYEKQRLQKLISNFQSSIQSNLFYCYQNHRQHHNSSGTGDLDDRAAAGGNKDQGQQQKYSTKESLILIHYVLGLMIFLQLPYSQIINPEVDQLVQKFIKRGLLQQEDQQIYLFRKVLEQYPPETFPKTFQFLSQFPLSADGNSSSSQTQQILLRTQSTLPFPQDLPPTARSSIKSSDLQSTGSSSSNLLALLTSSVKSSKSYTMLTSLLRQSSRIHDTASDEAPTPTVI